MKDGINNYVVHGQQDAVNPDEGRDEGVTPLPADSRSRKPRR